MNDAGARRGADLWLLAATFVIAVAGLVYELIAATTSSYLVGDSITQFSLVIGIFLSSMGLGAWLSRFVVRVENGFVSAQILLGLVGGRFGPADVPCLCVPWRGSGGYLHPAGRNRCACRDGNTSYRPIA